MCIGAAGPGAAPNSGKERRTKARRTRDDEQQQQHSGKSKIIIQTLWYTQRKTHSQTRKRQAKHASRFSNLYLASYMWWLFSAFPILLNLNQSKPLPPSLPPSLLPHLCLSHPFCSLSRDLLGHREEGHGGGGGGAAAESEGRQRAQGLAGLDGTAEEGGREGGKEGGEHLCKNERKNIYM